MWVYSIVVLLLCSGLIVSHDLCPVTSTMNLNNGSNYLYPVDIYAPHNLYSSLTSRNATFPCYADNKSVRLYKHQCSTTRLCPVALDNVDSATKVKYHKSSSLCHLKNSLANKKEKVNVYVLGGSVTGGSMSDGCTANDQTESRHMYRRCAWPYHFGEWLNANSSATVTMYNLAEAGQDCYVRSHTLSDTLNDRNITFTSNDVIFIDHSANDCGSPTARIEKGLESIVLLIYARSQPSSWPSIVVVDAFPPFSERCGVSPAIAYEKVVRHYNLSMWSYNAAVSSKYSLTAQKDYNDFISWKNNLEHNTHPMWHIHLFMADLYAAIFQAEMSHCTSRVCQLTSRLHNTRVSLPPPLSACNVENECTVNHQSPLLLSMSYQEIVDKRAIGKFETNPKDSWVVGEDVKGRGGLMVELKDGKYANNQDHATISFTLTESTKSLEQKKKENLHVQELHLRTYQNAGFAMVSVCGQTMCGLNALWNDYGTNHISIPDLFEQSFPLAVCVKANYSYPTITMTHRLLRVDDGFNEDNLRVRGNQKFKIMSIKVFAV